MGIGSLLDVSRRALNTQLQTIRVAGDNIANVNVPGHSRRRAQIVSDTSLVNGVGTGVGVERVARIVDKFINQELTNRLADEAKYEIRESFLRRAETPFNLNENEGSIGLRLSQFFSSLEDLKTNPADIPLRSQVIAAGEALVQSINNTYNVIASVQREADDRVRAAVDDINQITSQVAGLNQQLATSEFGSQENLTIRDQRDELLRDLSKKVKFTTVERGDGSILVSLSNGFPLINGGTSRTLEYETNPSFGTFPTGLDGSRLGAVVYDFDTTGAAPSHIDLTATIETGGGELGGLLSVRGVQATTDTDAYDARGDLVELGGRVEALARDLLIRFNAEYLGPDENTGTPIHESSSADLDGNLPTAVGVIQSVFSLFSFTGASDAVVDGLPTTADLATFTTITSFAQVMTFNITNPREIAAARDDNATAGATNFAPGDSKNIENPNDATNPGILGLRSSAPAGNYSTYGIGTINDNTSIEDFYDFTVTRSGSISSRASDDFVSFKARRQQVEELQSSISGVSTDDEFTQLITSQNAFRAAARLVQTADNLFGEVIGLLR